MKKAVHQLLSFLMVLVMLFDAAPITALAESTPAPRAVDSTEIQTMGEIAVKEYRELSAGEYTIEKVADPSAYEYLTAWQPKEEEPAEPAAEESSAVPSAKQQVKGLVAYDIQPVQGTASAKKYGVTVPVDVDMLADYRDSDKILTVDSASYQLFHLRTDEDGETTVEPISAEDVTVKDSNGEITSFFFKVDSFSTFVLTYAVEFTCIDTIGKLQINLENLAKSVGESLRVVRENDQYVTILNVAGMLAESSIPESEDDADAAPCKVTLLNGTTKEAFGSEFWSNAAAQSSADGVEVADGFIRLTGDVELATVAFATQDAVLTVEISNYTQPAVPVVPETTDGFAYRFEGETAKAADILDANEIVSSYYKILSVSDESLVVPGEDGVLTAQDYFDELLLTLSLSPYDDTEVQIRLTNPAPAEYTYRAKEETVLLSDVFAALKITAEIASVESSTEKIVISSTKADAAASTEDGEKKETEKTETEETKTDETKTEETKTEEAETEITTLVTSGDGDLLVTAKDGTKLVIHIIAPAPAVKGKVKAAATGAKEITIAFDKEAGLPGTAVLTAQAVTDDNAAFAQYKDLALSLAQSTFEQEELEKKAQEELEKKAQEELETVQAAPVQMRGGLRMMKSAAPLMATQALTDDSGEAKAEADSAENAAVSAQGAVNSAITKSTTQTKVAGVFELTLQDTAFEEGDNELQPKEAVTVSLELDQTLPADSKVYAIHFYTDENNEEQQEAIKATAKSTENGTVVSFPAEGFSVYAITYTVGLYSGGYTHHLMVGQSITLSKLLTLFGLKKISEVASVEFSNPELMTVEALENDWLLTCLKHADNTTQTLTVTLANGEVYTIDVADAGITQQYVAADGETYEINVKFDAVAQLPVDAVLSVEEIGPTHEKYQEYLAQALAALGVNAEPANEEAEEETTGEGEVTGEEEAAAEAQNQYARFFDISIMQGSQKVQPQANVTVSIKLADAPEDEELKVVHFDEADGLVVMEAERDENDNLLVMTDSFSVYGVIQLNNTANDLDGKSAKIGCGGYYLTNETDYRQRPWVIKKNDISQAAEYTFEAMGSAGVYAIYTMVNGQKNYIHINHNSEDPGDNGSVNLTDYGPMNLNVTLESDGTYRISRTIDGRTYYLNQHYGDGGPGFATYIDGNSNNSKMTFEFTTSFLVTDLEGRAFTLSHNGVFVTDEIQEVEGVASLLAPTNNAAEATIWYFEDAGTEGRYYIFTFKNGEKKYLKLNRRDGYSAHAYLGDDRQVFSVFKNGSGYNFYTISTSRPDAPTPYYLSYQKKPYVDEYGFRGFNCATPGGYELLDINFTNTLPQQPNDQYIVLVKRNGEYYQVENDGTLTHVEYHDGIVEVDTPMVWTFENGNHLYHHSTQVDFDSQQLPSDYYYRYIDPNRKDADNNESKPQRPGLTEEYNGDVELRNSGYWDQDNWVDTGKRVNDRSTMWNNTAIVYDAYNHTLRSATNGSYYLGVDPVNNRIVGQASESEAGEVYLAKVAIVPESQNLNHTVNHIDISIKGGARMDTPLAYGDYYYYNQNNQICKLEVRETNNVTLELTVDNVPLEPEDMKHSTVTAFTPEKGILDNAFYITGYSRNQQNNLSTQQIRIEGSFKVADLEPYKNTTEDALEDTDESTPLQDRLDNRIYYTVTVQKDITFNWEYTIGTDSQGDPIKAQLYPSFADAQAQTNPFFTEMTVNLSKTFDYWDKANECPPIRLLGGQSAWEKGHIVWDTSAHAGSGMDFKLEAQETDTTVALEIFKYLRTVDDNNAESPLLPKEDIINFFTVYQKTADYASDIIAAVGVGVGTPAPEQTLPTAYGKGIHVKPVIITAGRSEALVYDYDIQNGMAAIKEDADSIARSIVDVNGKRWDYIGTRTETEYAWRDDGDERKWHVAEGVTSIPEVVTNRKEVGPHNSYNKFLMFRVYNIYKQVELVDVPITKTWADFTGSEYDWTATFQMQYTEQLDTNYSAGTNAQPVTELTDIGDPITISKNSTLEQRTMKDLPKYRYDEYGNRYIRFYSAVETAYRVTKNGSLVYSFDGTNYYDANGQQLEYLPAWDHTANENNDGDYELRLHNIHYSITEGKITDVKISKQWAVNDAEIRDADSSYATFALKRKVHYETTDWNGVNQNAANIIITLVVGGTYKDYYVKPNQQVWIVSNFTANSTEDVGFYQSYVHDNTYLVTLSHAASSSDEQVRSSALTFTQNTTIVCQRGNLSCFVGGADGVYLTTHTNPTTAVEDTSFGEQFTLNKANGWSKYWDKLPKEVCTFSGTTERITIYDYYFEEIASRPIGFHAEFTSKETDNLVNVLATNVRETEFRVVKDWGEGGSADYQPGIVYELYRKIRSNNTIELMGTYMLNSSGGYQLNTTTHLIADSEQMSTIPWTMSHYTNRETDDELYFFLVREIGLYSVDSNPSMWIVTPIKTDQLTTQYKAHPAGNGTDFKDNWQDAQLNPYSNSTSGTPELTISNRGKLTVTKTVKLNNAEDSTHDGVAKTFHVALFTRSGSEGSYTYTRVSDVKRITVGTESATGTAQFNDLIIGKTYYVFETDSTGNTRYEAAGPDGYNVTYASQEAVIAIAKKASSVTNNRNTGSLTVSKTVSGASEAEMNSDEFTFTVTLTAPSGVTLAASYPATKTSGSTPTTETFAVSPGTFTLKAGETYIIQGLPAGTTYSVVETANSNYNSAISGGTNSNGTGTIANTANSTVTVTAENTRKKNDLSLTKQLTGSNLPSDSNTKLFTFQVALSGAGLAQNQEYNLAWTGTDRPSGVPARLSSIALSAAATGTGFTAEVPLLAGETATIQALPQGVTYEVSEIYNPAGYSETTDSQGGTKTGTIGDTTSTVTIVNSYEASPIPYAPKITKTITGNWPEGVQFGFTLAAAGTYTNEQLTMPDTLTANATSSAPTAAFKAVTFKTEGTYAFTITENVPEDAVNASGTAYSAASPKTGWFVKDGIAYDATPVNVSVTVTDNNNGALVVSSVSYNGGTAVTGTDISDASGSITNIELTSIHAKKVWTLDNVEMAAWPTGKTVTFQLQQNNGTTEAPNWQAVVTDVLGTAIADQTVADANVVSFTNLPNDKTYRVVETAVDGTPLTNVIVATGTGYGTSNDPLTITNPLKTVTVTKAWSSSAGTEAPANASIVLGLYKGANQDQLVSSITLNGTVDQEASGYEYEAWKAKWTNLPVYEANGTPITYVVKETTGMSGYTVSYNNSEYQYAPNNGTITNTLNETSINVLKQDSTDHHALSGAQFTLYKLPQETTMNQDTGKTTTTDTWPVYTYGSEYANPRTTNDSGELTFSNLTDGTYKLLETQAPAGYNALTQEILFTINNGVVSYSQGSSTVTYESNNNTFTVPNTPGVELPATGGSGTLPYYLSGLTLTLGAALWLIFRRKRRENT